MDEGTAGIGSRLREIRAVRGLSLRAAAELAGYSASYLSLIENGERIIDKRSTLEAFARALRVAPSELTGQPYPATDRAQATGHAAAPALRGVLRDIEIGELDVTPRSIEQIRADVAAVRAHCAASDYAAMAGHVPALIGELHSLNAAPRGGAEARRLLAHVLLAGFYLSKDLGHGDLAWTMSGHLHRAAAATSEPSWAGLAEFIRAEAMVGDGARRRAFGLAARSADALAGESGAALEMHGMLHLQAALHSAALRAPDVCADHLREAEAIAQVTGEGQFADLHFGPRNVGVWRVALTVELGEGGRARELATEVNVAAIPSAGRRAMFHADLGRGMSTERATRPQAVESLLRAEDSAPQLIRANFYVRETVTELLSRPLPDNARRELRGMAWRMGIAA